MSSQSSPKLSSLFLDEKELKTFVYNNRITFAASAGSLTSTFLGYPLDSIKSRLQVKRYGGVIDCLRTTLAEEGIPGLFRGVGIPLLTVTIVRTTSFSIYDRTKRSLVSNGIFADENKIYNKAALGFCGGATSGILISVGSCPFELVKIRSQLEYLIAAKQGRPFAPIGTLGGTLSLWREAGFRGFYYGLSLHTFRDTAGTGLYFASYDVIRSAIGKKINESSGFGPIAPFLSGAVSGIGSWGLIYPCDVVKTRVQRDALAGVEPRENAREIFRRLASRGIGRLYSGIGISVARSCITHGIIWVIIEDLSNRIERKYRTFALDSE